ncbi:MAG: hypothetical protein IT349_06950 [Candidatus Eisenbacteria bacterium]|nr:hypothetical protein [Candidatus Eisenbacteria bacterium]
MSEPSGEGKHRPAGAPPESPLDRGPNPGVPSGGMPLPSIASMVMSATGAGGSPPAGAAQLSDDELIDKVAERIVLMNLTAPAVFFLESSKPLSYVGSQALVFLEPFIKTFLNLAYYDRFVALMEDRGSVERLIARIEERDETLQQQERERKRAERAQRVAAGLEPSGWRRLIPRFLRRR